MVLDLQYSTAQGRHAFEEVQTAARVADRPFLPVYLESTASTPATRRITAASAGVSEWGGKEFERHSLQMNQITGGGSGSTSIEAGSDGGERRGLGDSAGGAAADGPTTSVEEAELTLFRATGIDGLSVETRGRSGVSAAWKIHEHVCNLEQGARWVDLEGDDGDGEWSLVSKGVEPKK